MQLRLTVLDPADPARGPVELAVEAPADTPFGRIRPQLESLTPASTFLVDGHPLLDAALLGHEPLVRGVTITAGRDLGSSAKSTSSGVVELSVVGGHGAGRTFRLGRGDHVIGRAPSTSVCLDDPDVSRAHAVISVGPDAVSVRDLEPTNRSVLDDRPLPQAGASLNASSRLRVGSTTLSLPQVPGGPGHHRVAGGLIHVHRPPRFVEQRAPLEVRFPQGPARPDAARAPLLAALAPLVLSAGLALALSSPAMLLFALMSPVLLLGQWWSERRAGRTSYRRLMRDHRHDVETARASVLSAVQADARQRRSEQPDLVTVAEIVRRRTTMLWQRRPGDPDHLLLRIGTARQSARITLEGAPDEPVPDVDDLPVAVDLERAGVVGLAGEREAVLSTVGAMIAQLAAWHSPRDVHLRVLAASRRHARDWGWAAYLPHGAAADGGTADVPAPGERAFVDAVAQLGLQLAARQDGSATTMHIADRTALILDGAGELRATPGVAELLRDGPAAGILVVCLDRDGAALPTEANAVIELADSRGRARLRTLEHTIEGIIPDLPTPGWLHGFARLAAPLVDSTPQSGVAALPDLVSFRELHAESGLDVTSHDGLIASWSSGPGRPAALVGLMSDGPREVDLVRDGPHMLVGGTTGAGKSELLRALVAGLAVRSRPDDLTFVLVDYKGGSAFGECAALPHVLGVVTDLDEALTRRALTSLDAELRRRERLLARAGASDFAEYAEIADDVCRPHPRLARLVIVVDEFKMLADELPDFVSGLVRIATVGRSLGVHLVLATQRPAGVVSADMRANVALRIALRMRDSADSIDVIEAADAASISDLTPGRALVRGGDGRLVAVQTAYVSGAFHVADTLGDDPVQVRVVGERSDANDRERQSSQQETGTELGAVVRAAREAANRLEVAIPESPWLPALPDIVGADRMPSVDGWIVPLGLADDPAQQRQIVQLWDLDSGSLGVVGGPRSGRSTALVAIALRLAGRYAVDDLHVHVLQASPGPCDALTGLPHTGAVVDGSDPALVRRVVNRLTSGRGSAQAPQRTLVVVDGWDALEHSLSPIDAGVAVDELYDLVRDGDRLGLRLVISGGRSLLSGRLPGLLADRLLLHLTDPVDLTLAGLDLAASKTARPPGRAIDLRTGLDVQLALPGSLPSADSTASAIAGVRTPPTTECARPWTIEPLPESVAQRDLSSRPGLLSLGRGGDDGRELGFDPGQGHRRIMVAGAPRMGTTNALAVVVARLAASGRPVAVIARHQSSIFAWATAHGCHALQPEDATALVDLRSTIPDLCLVVDEAERLEGSPIEPVLLDCARNIAGTTGVLVVGADLSRALASFRGLVPEVARDANGLILGAVAPTDGDLFGIRLATAGRRRRGRGFIVVDGQAEPIQVALAQPP